jgi:hypothetical protein
MTLHPGLSNSTQIEVHMYYPFFGAMAPFVQHIRSGPSFLELQLLTQHRDRYCGDYGFNFPSYGHCGYGYGYRNGYGRYY